MEFLRKADYTLWCALKDRNDCCSSQPFRALFDAKKVTDVLEKLAAGDGALNNRERAVLVNAYRQHLFAEVFLQLSGEKPEQATEPRLLCREFCDVISEVLLPAVPEKDSVSRVRYQTWLAEFLLFGAMLSEEEEAASSQDIFNAYDVATKLAYVHLAPCDPFRLEVSFLFSLFLFVNVKNYLVALELASDALERALGSFEKEESASNFLCRVWIALLLRLTEACLSKVEDENASVPLIDLFTLPVDVLQSLEQVILAASPDK